MFVVVNFAVLECIHAINMLLYIGCIQAVDIVSTLCMYAKQQRPAASLIDLSLSGCMIFDSKRKSLQNVFFPLSLLFISFSLQLLYLIAELRLELQVTRGKNLLNKVEKIFFSSLLFFDMYVVFSLSCKPTVVYV